MWMEDEEVQKVSVDNSTEVCLGRERDAGSCSLKCCFEVQTLEELNADRKG